MKSNRCTVVLLYIILLVSLFSGCSSKTGEKPPLNDSEIVNDFDKTGEELILTNGLLENYAETEIAFDPQMAENSESYSAILLNAEEEIEYFTAGGTESGTSVFQYTLNNEGKWDREEVLWLKGLKDVIDQKRITVLLGEDGNYYAHYVAEGEMSHFVKKDNEEFTEIMIPDWDKTEERDVYMIPDSVAVLENGNIVMASRQGICYVYDKMSGEIADSFQCGGYTSMTVEGNYILILDKEGRSVLVYDTVQQKTINEIYGNFESRVLLSSKEDILYACLNKGILKTNLSMNEWEAVLDPGTFKFANPSSGLFKFFAGKDGFYIFYTEGAGRLMKYVEKTENQESFTNQAPAAQEKENQQLTIYSLKENSTIREAITEFQLKHPEIPVIYETGEITAGAVSEADSIRALNTRLMNGEGPDIFLLEGLPADSYIEKGILYDLKEGMSGYLDELHQKVLDAYTTEDGSVYMFPIRINMPVFLVKSEHQDSILSLESLVEWSESSEKYLTDEMTYEEAFDLLYHYYIPEMFLEEQEINQDSIRHFLTLVKRFCDSENVYEPDNGEALYSKIENTMGKRFHFSLDETALVFEEISGMGYLYDLPNLVEDSGGLILANQNTFIPTGLIGISQSSRNQEEAFLFLEEALSFPVQSLNSIAGHLGYPVNNAALEEIRTFDLSDHVIMGTNKVTGKSLESRRYNQKEASQIVDMINLLEKSQPMDVTAAQIFKEEAVPYLKGLEDLETVVEGIRNRLELYLFE